MIVPMIKYSFAIHHVAYQQFLDNIQQLGVIHIIKKEGQFDCDETLQLNEKIEKTRQAIEQLNRFSDVNASAPTNSSISTSQAIAQSEELVNKLELLKHKQDSLKNKIDDQSLWGDYSDQLINDLQNAGIPVRFYSVSTKKFQSEWKEQFPIEVINHTDKEVLFASFGIPEQNWPGAREVKLAAPLSELNNEYQLISNELEQLTRQIHDLSASSLPSLKIKLEHLEHRQEWLDIRNNQTDTIGEGTVQILEGWVPATNKLELKQYLEQEKIVYIEQEAEHEDQPPIVLRNNKFGKLFEPIARLFSLPHYSELDLTIYFAPFFMLFFGFCLGDAGYGLVLLLGTTVYKKFASADLKPYLTLGQLFGASTLVMGLIFGTLFGIELAKVPALDPVKDLFLESSQVFNLSLIIGAIQIIFGIILRIKNQLQSKTPTVAISSAGWLFLFLTAGIFEFLLKEKESSQIIQISEIAMYSLSLTMILLFSGTGPIHMRLTGGLWEMYNTVTGIFGDLLSYIRLFALGIASSILGLVINQMAASFGTAPYIGPVIFILIIVIGHTANLAISSLGAFVHPMRLTFVEFYKNAGFKGGGKPYMPFTNQRKKY